MKKKQKRLRPSEAKILKFELKDNDSDGRYAKYSLTQYQIELLFGMRGKTIPNDTDNIVDYKSDPKQEGYKEPFFLSAYCRKTDSILSIEDFCKKYNQPFADIVSHKFLPLHYSEPSYNIMFREKHIDIESSEIDFNGIISKHINRLDIEKVAQVTYNDFDMLTYTDVHIGMDTDSRDNSMYATLWNGKEVMHSCDSMIKTLLEERSSDTLIVDELGDLLDGYNGETTRGGHHLPQNMTNEEVFDCALKFKMRLLDRLIPFYTKIVFNNICNDNHAGSFGYFVNSAFKSLAEQKYANVEVNNYRKFINHYYIGDVCFVITHGKDDATLKFGFKPQLDSKQIEKIDQYLKNNDIYAKAKLIVFKKGDSHQALFNMSGSDDFFYYNYPALSPSSQWVQNNFKRGRRGFVIEKYKGINNTVKPVFL